MRAVVLALSLLLPGNDLAWLDTMPQAEPSLKPLALEPGCAQTAELQGIQAEAAPGVEQGLKFWCTLCGCQQSATMGRLWPGCNLPTVHPAHPETGQPQLTSALRQSALGWHRGESRTPAWAAGRRQNHHKQTSPASN